MKTILTFLAMCFALVIPAAQGFAQDQGTDGTAQEVAVEKPALYVMVIESLPQVNAHNRFIMLKSIFNEAFGEQDWPVSEIKVVRFGSNPPEDAMVLKVFVTDWRYRIQGQIEFRCAVELKYNGQKDKLGMIVGKHQPRPILTAIDEDEAYKKAARKAAEQIAEKLTEGIFSGKQAE